MEAVTFKDLLTWSGRRAAAELKLATTSSSPRRAVLQDLPGQPAVRGATTLLCLFIGYPFAYFMARAKPTVQPALLMLVMLPFWTSLPAARVCLARPAHRERLGGRAAHRPGPGPAAVRLGLISTPGKLMHTPFSLVLGMTYTYLPFMILPLYGNLAKMDLRCSRPPPTWAPRPGSAFWKVTVPLSKAGIIAGSMLVFIPCVGEFVIPELLGGPETLMIGRVLWDEFFSNNDWPMASSVAVVMVLLIIVPLAIFNKYQAEAQERSDEGRRLQPLVRPRLAARRLRLPVPADRRAGHLLVQRLAAAQRLARLHAEVVRAALASDERCWPACG
jgi:putrescine transport system permease protein